MTSSGIVIPDSYPNMESSHVRYFHTTYGDIFGYNERGNSFHRNYGLVTAMDHPHYQDPKPTDLATAPLYRRDALGFRRDFPDQGVLTCNKPAKYVAANAITALGSRPPPVAPPSPVAAERTLLAATLADSDLRPLELPPAEVLPTTDVITERRVLGDSYRGVDASGRGRTPLERYNEPLGSKSAALAASPISSFNKSTRGHYNDDSLPRVDVMTTQWQHRPTSEHLNTPGAQHLNDHITCRPQYANPSHPNYQNAPLSGYSSDYSRQAHYPSNPPQQPQPNPQFAPHEQNGRGNPPARSKYASFNGSAVARSMQH